jgi:hypothetical protein
MQVAGLFDGLGGYLGFHKARGLLARLLILRPRKNI